MLDAFRGIQSAHDTLGNVGRELMGTTNRFGDPLTHLYVRAELEMIATTRLWQAENHDFAFQMVTMSHGTFFIGPKDDPDVSIITVFLDGLNGSRQYTEGGPYGYGSVVTFARGSDPRYSDIMASGILRLDTQEVLFRAQHSTTMHMRAHQLHPAADTVVLPSYEEWKAFIMVDGSDAAAARVVVPLNFAGYDCRSTKTMVGNMFNMVTGRLVEMGGTTAPVLAVCGAFDSSGTELPAMAHLADGVGGGLYLTKTGREATSQRILSVAPAEGEPTDCFVLAADPLRAGAVLSSIM